MSNTLRTIFGLVEKAASLKKPAKWSKDDFDSYLKGRKFKQGTGNLRKVNQKPALKDILMGRAARDGGSSQSHTRQAFWAGMAGVKTPAKKKETPPVEDVNDAVNPSVVKQRELGSIGNQRDMASVGSQRKIKSVGTKRLVTGAGVKRERGSGSSIRVWGNS
tara:strand:- start:785 stop:1270 length:486 start_codon:yes stop_codon:yes gene_type:complete